MIITIDGPVASGKSTVARMLAQRLGYFYIYSGLLFRALAFLLVSKGGYTKEQLSNVYMKDVDIYIDPKKFVYQYDEKNVENIFFDGVNITPCLQSNFVDSIASIVSVNEYVRKCIAEFQQKIVCSLDVVADGRDVGSCVFPQAEVKFFLTASSEIRAQRWQKKQKKENNVFSIVQSLQIINERDNRDKARKIDPLIIPKDALIVDSSNKTVEETVKIMLVYCKINDLGN